MYMNILDIVIRVIFTIILMYTFRYVNIKIKDINNKEVNDWTAIAVKSIEYEIGENDTDEIKREMVLSFLEQKFKNKVYEEDLDKLINSIRYDLQNKINNSNELIPILENTNYEFEEDQTEFVEEPSLTVKILKYRGDVLDDSN